MRDTSTPLLPPYLTDWSAGADGATGVRIRGADTYRATGWPTKRQERWRFTDVKTIGEAAFPPALPLDALPAMPATSAPALATADDPIILRLVDGQLIDPIGALPMGLTITPLTAATADAALVGLIDNIRPERPDSLWALGDAWLRDGLIITASAPMDRPVHVVWASVRDGVAVYPRLTVDVTAEAKLTLYESLIGADAVTGLAAPTRGIRMGAGAVCQHYIAQALPTTQAHLATSTIELGERARYDGFTLTRGAALSRHDVTARLSAHSHCRLNGAYLIAGRQHADATSFIHHAEPDAQSHQIYKGVIGGEAQGVFQGKIRVAQDAQRTDGYQLNKALLLSDTAGISSKPELEIYADDVKCSHGATVGELDAEALFYLRARGVGRSAAEALLIAAFIGEAIEAIEHEPARAAFAAVTQGWLEGRA
jgi:Fe-S cluster assembly protein SufD